MVQTYLAAAELAALERLLALPCQMGFPILLQLAREELEEPHPVLRLLTAQLALILFSQPSLLQAGVAVEQTPLGLLAALAAAVVTGLLVVALAATEALARPQQSRALL